MTTSAKTFLQNFQNFYFSKATFYSLKHSNILEFVKNLKKIKVKKIGVSFLGKDIFLLKKGSGNEKIIIWSQMHGNEPLSTLATLDFIMFLEKNISPEFNKLLENNITLYFIPMLNPDGADLFTRRNAQGIDINRDAIRKTSPEAQILSNTIDTIKPKYAFNLHDQEIYYGNSLTEYPTTLSFLAPAFDKQKTIDNNRLISMQIIGYIIENLPMLKGKIAKYNDTFMPMAFGDNTQKKGIRTILFEGGYIPEDKNREKVRKWYAFSIFLAIEAIALKAFSPKHTTLYSNLPLNIKDLFFEYILKNINIQKFNKIYSTDIGIRYPKINDEDFAAPNTDLIIADIGDLSFYNAFKTIDCQSITIKNKNNAIKKYAKANFLLNICLKNI